MESLEVSTPGYWQGFEHQNAERATYHFQHRWLPSISFLAHSEPTLLALLKNELAPPPPWRRPLRSAGRTIFNAQHVLHPPHNLIPLHPSSKYDQPPRPRPLMPLRRVLAQLNRDRGMPNPPIPQARGDEVVRAANAVVGGGVDAEDGDALGDAGEERGLKGGAGEGERFEAGEDWGVVGDDGGGRRVGERFGYDGCSDWRSGVSGWECAGEGRGEGAYGRCSRRRVSGRRWGRGGLLEVRP